MKTILEQEAFFGPRVTWVLCLALLALVGCTDSQPEPAPELEAATAATGCSSPIDLGTPYPPAQPPAGANNTTDCTYDIFAWQTFVALQWPALQPTQQNGYKRGFADTSAGVSFTSEDDPDLPVWETWKAKREVFTGICGDNRDWTGNLSGCGKSPEDALPQNAPAGWNSTIDYGTTLSSGSFTVCSDAADPAAVENALMDNFQQFHMGSKINSEGLDENKEVKGEAYFPASLRGQGVKPEVFASASGNPIVYEVKINYDWFDYVVTQNGFYDTTTKASAASAGSIALPERSASYTPANCNDSSDFPCAMGTIETKSAWVLQGSEDASRYHSTQALYFKDDGSSPSGLCADLGNFLLTGFHINQKTANQPDFIFATWGHVDNGKDNNQFRYQNEKKKTLYPTTSNDPVPGTGYGVGYITTTQESADGGPVYSTTPLDRIPTWTQTLNQVVQNQIKTANPSSVWQYYQLVGTQFAPTNSDDTNGTYPIGSNDPGNLGQSFYLANLTLETNWGLQNFQGQPPGINPISKYSSIIPSQCQGASAYDRSCPNTVLNGAGYNMGGCMGCHGVAQQSGYDFSFVLLGGGGDIETTPAAR